MSQDGMLLSSLDLADISISIPRRCRCLVGGYVGRTPPNRYKVPPLGSNTLKSGEITTDVGGDDGDGGEPRYSNTPITGRFKALMLLED